MIIKIDMYLRDPLERFAKQEDGIALTEYLTLLGLLLGGVFTAVAGFNDSLTGVWDTFTAWLSSNAIVVPF